MIKKLIFVKIEAEFIDLNLIELLLSKISDNMISIYNYSVGTKNNQIKNIRISYEKDNILDFLDIEIK